MVTKLGANTELTIPAQYMKELRLLYCTVNDSTVRDTMVGMANATKTPSDPSDNFADILSVATDPEMDFCRSSSLGADSTEYTLGKGWITVFRNLLVSPLASTTGTGQLCDRITSRMNTLLFYYDFPEIVKTKMEKEHKAFLEEDAAKEPSERVWNEKKELEFQQRLNACIETISPHITSPMDDSDIVWGLQKYPIINGHPVYEDVREFCKETYIMGRGGKPDEAPKGSDEEGLPWYLKQQKGGAGPFERNFVAGLLNIPWPAWVEYQEFCTPVSTTEMVMSPVRYGSYVFAGWVAYLARKAIQVAVVGSFKLLYQILGIPLTGVKNFLLELVDHFMNRRPPTGGATPDGGAAPEPEKPTKPQKSAKPQKPADAKPAKNGGRGQPMQALDPETAPQFVPTFHPLPALPKADLEKVVPVAVEVGVLAYLTRLLLTKANPAVAVYTTFFGEAVIDEVGNSFECGVLDRDTPKCKTWKDIQKERALYQNML